MSSEEIKIEKILNYSALENFLNIKEASIDIGDIYFDLKEAILLILDSRGLIQRGSDEDYL